jgi:hypothetical protein
MTWLVGLLLDCTAAIMVLEPFGDYVPINTSPMRHLDGCQVAGMSWSLEIVRIDTGVLARPIAACCR